MTQFIFQALPLWSINTSQLYMSVTIIVNSFTRHWLTQQFLILIAHMYAIIYWTGGDGENIMETKKSFLVQT